MTDLSRKEQVILELGRNRRLAHKTFFTHRHPQESPDFHYEIMDLWSSKRQHALVMAFRGAAKSTLAEEAITLAACYREFHNCIILAETYHRAVERLAVIRRELETNDIIRDLFGDLVGATWTENKLVLANDVIIQAFGRGQSLRGSKHLDWRPDLAFGDDVEDDESCSSDDLIDKTKRWLLNVVLPAMAPGYKMRINGTPLHPRSVLMQLYGDPEWVHRVYPIITVDPATGERRATWPQRFPLAEVDKLEARAQRLGNMTGYRQEYMCEAENPADKPFTADLLRVDTSLQRTWQGVYVMYDPARTTNKTSATTGKVVWSWMADKLVVWDAGAHFWKPDELIADLFATDQTYNPVAIYIEEDGLNEWLLQPIRSEQLRRGYILPVQGVKAPKGKHDFIRQLQAFFKGGQIVFAKDLPELTRQLLDFPSGRIDAPNALAYALRLRGGPQVYDGFTLAHIAGEMPVVPRTACYLALNATAQHTTGILLQLVEGSVHVLADWVRDGDPGTCLGDIVAAAGLAAAGGGALRLVAGPNHFSDHDTVGLRAAAARIPVGVNLGGQPTTGRETIRDLLTRQMHGRPALRVSPEARWTLNAFSGGYAYELTKHATLSDFTRKGAYRCLMEGLESAAGLLVMQGADEGERRYARAPDGRRYLTALDNAEPTRMTKADWGVTLSPQGNNLRG